MVDGAQDRYDAGFLHIQLLQASYWAVWFGHRAPGIKIPKGQAPLKIHVVVGGRRQLGSESSVVAVFRV